MHLSKILITNGDIRELYLRGNYQRRRKKDESSQAVALSAAVKLIGQHLESAFRVIIRC